METNNANDSFKRNQRSNLTDNEAQNLKYDERKNSYELDVNPVEPEEQDYQHPDPYDTTAENGADFNSDYDEANPYVGNEYDKNASLENDVEGLGMRVTGEQSFKLSKEDEEIAKTEEDNRDDLDEEGYPKYLK